LIVGLVPAAGCPMPTRRVVLPVQVPARFSQSGGAKLPGRWWSAFGDPELNRLVGLALASNPGLGIAWARLDQARAVARKAKAGLYPTLDATAGISGTLARDGRSASVTAGLAASYEVDLWGRVRATRDAAWLELLATREGLMAAAISLSAEITNAWYQLVERQGQLRLLDHQLATSKQVLLLVTLNFQQGQGGAVDVLQQRQLVESLKGERTGVRAQAQVLRHQLAILVGKPPGTLRIKRVQQLPLLPPLPRAGIPSSLLQRRPDVRSVYLKVRAANRRVAVALADRYPRLSLGASASLTGGVNPGAFYTWLTNLVANLIAPLFDGGARKAEVARTRAVAAEALQEYSQTILVALREVEDALTRERQQKKLIVSLDRQLRLSGRVVLVSSHSYLNGVETFLRVLDAQLRHQSLQRARLTAGRDGLLQRVALCRALAGGWTLSRPGAKAKTSTTARASAMRPAPRSAR